MSTETTPTTPPARLLELFDRIRSTLDLRTWQTWSGPQWRERLELQMDQWRGELSRISSDLPAERRMMLGPAQVAMQTAFRVVLDGHSGPSLHQQTVAALGDTAAAVVDNLNARDSEAIGDGFRSVRWGNVPYTFTKTQSKCVEVLYRNHQQGTPDVPVNVLLNEAHSESARLVDVFGSEHPAWNTLIIKGKGKGTYRLAEPSPLPKKKKQNPR